MIRRLKKFMLVIVAFGLVIGNTDAGIGGLLLFAPENSSTLRLFVLFALIANLEALIWYKLGPILAEVLGEVYVSLQKVRESPRTFQLTIWPLRAVLSILRPFYYWEDSKKKVRAKLETVFKSPKYVVLTIGSWLIVPGSRSITAVLFGMEEWPGAMFVLLVVNTLHVALSFGFWSALAALIDGIRKLVF